MIHIAMVLQQSSVRWYDRLRRLGWALLAVAWALLVTLMFK